jgi:small subunit ribosomal protein S20
MNKKQKNRKIVTQNKRNRMQNRRYSSTIKTLLKLFKSKTQEFSNSNDNIETNDQQKSEISILGKRLYSILDKAVKKNVIHKNNAARKKSKIGIFLRKL